VPFLRVIRDKRGYETTYLMDWHREGDKQRSHILYVFRTPGGVRVGRSALDPEMRREVEARYPEITFDWNDVLKSQHVVEAAADVRRLRKRRRVDGEGAPGVSRPDAQPAPVPTSIQGTTPDERVAFLQQWYPAIRQRIEQRQYDEARRAALLGLAERLNPALWSDADQITTGLEQAVEALDRLTRVLSKRRRRSKRAGKAEGQVSPTARSDQDGGQAEISSTVARAPDPPDPDPAEP